MARYVRGTHNALCDRCGFKFKRNEMRMTWDNLLVCQEDYEPKHPQLTLNPRPDRQAVRDVRDRNRDTELLDPPITNDQLV